MTLTLTLTLTANFFLLPVFKKNLTFANIKLKGINACR